MYNEFFENDFTIQSINVNDAEVSFVAHYPEDTDGYNFSVLPSSENTPVKDNGKLYRCFSTDRKTYYVTVNELLGGKLYYCRPAVEISSGVYKYGPIKSFTTKAFSHKFLYYWQLISIFVLVYTPAQAHQHETLLRISNHGIPSRNGRQLSVQ